MSTLYQWAWMLGSGSISGKSFYCAKAYENRYASKRRREGATSRAIRRCRIARVNTYDISDDPHRLDIDAIHGFLSQTYWSPGIPRTVVARAIAHSLCFGVYREGAQVGFARVITDRATFGYLADVYILEPHRGLGLSRRLVEAIRAHPELQGLRRLMLATRDAHALYAQHGFSPLAAPDRFMEIHAPDAYKAA